MLLPLHMALLRKAPLNLIQGLVEKNPLAVKQVDSFGMMPLHLACQSGLSLDVCRYLSKQHPAACRHLDETERTPLHLACASHALRKDVIVFLLGEYPQAAHMKDGKGYTPEEYIGPHPHQSRLLQEMRRGTEYWDANSSDATELSRCIVQRQWEKASERIHTTKEASRWVMVGGKRFLPLHLACRCKAPPSVVEALLEANPAALHTPCEKYNMIPLHMACQHGASHAVIQLLLTTEAAKAADEHGLLPLHLACTEGLSVQVVEALLYAYPEGALTRDAKGFTPLVYIQASKHPHGKQISSLLTSTAIVTDAEEENLRASLRSEQPVEDDENDDDLGVAPWPLSESPQSMGSALHRQQSKGLISRPSIRSSI